MFYSEIRRLKVQQRNQRQTNYIRLHCCAVLRYSVIISVSYIVQLNFSLHASFVSLPGVFVSCDALTPCFLLLEINSYFSCLIVKLVINYNLY